MAVIIKNADKEEFDKIANNPDVGVVFIDFWAEWCGPCRMASKVIEEFAATHITEKDIYILKIDVDKETELAQRYNISSLPTIIAVKDGIMQNGSEAVGALSFKRMSEYFNKYLK